MQARGHPSVMLLVGSNLPTHLCGLSTPSWDSAWLLLRAAEGLEWEALPWDAKENLRRDPVTGREGTANKGLGGPQGGCVPEPPNPTPFWDFGFCSIRISLLEQEESPELSWFHSSDEKTEVYRTEVTGSESQGVADAERELAFPDSWASGGSVSLTTVPNSSNPIDMLPVKFVTDPPDPSLISVLPAAPGFHSPAVWSLPPHWRGRQDSPFCPYCKGEEMELPERRLANDFRYLKGAGVRINEAWKGCNEVLLKGHVDILLGVVKHTEKAPLWPCALRHCSLLGKAEAIRAP